MNVAKHAGALALGLMLGFGCGAPALAADGDAMQSFATEMHKMANKDGMVSKKDFMKMMEKKWDDMDKSQKGMLSEADVMRIFGRIGTP